MRINHSNKKIGDARLGFQSLRTEMYLNFFNIKLKMIPNATLRPGEVRLEIIQVGYLRGIILNGNSTCGYREFLDGEVEEDFQALKSVKDAPLQGLCRQLAATRQRDVYLERFVEKATSNPQLQEFRQEVDRLARKYILSPDIALGLAGLYFFLKKEYSEK